MTMNQAATTVRNESIRVLLADDDITQVDLVESYLHMTGNYEIDTATNACEAWELVSERPYDIVLMDYRMPDGTGIDIMRKMSEFGYDVPVVMVSGFGDEEIAAQAIHMGAVDFLIKNGTHLGVLPAVIHKVIRAHELQRSYEESMGRIRYQALLLNNMRDAVVVWDLQDRITYWNPAAQALFGYSALEMIGKDVREFYLSKFTPPITPPSPENTVAELERRFKTRDGNTIWVSSRVSILRDFESENRAIGVMDVARDITPRKQMEAQIQAAHEQLAQSARMAAIGELAAGLAHQINNPLTTIIAESQILLNKLPQSHVARESAEAIEKAGWRTQSFVQQLADISRPVPRTLQMIDVNRTIQGALGLVSEHLENDSISLQVDLEPRLPILVGYPHQLEDLWINLLLLARDATGDGCKHTIRVVSRQIAQSGVRVEIFDDGEPIPKDQLYDLFQFNLNRPSIGRGTGIELSTCSEIVKRHRGEISVHSNEKTGTVFRVVLPTEE